MNAQALAACQAIAHDVMANVTPEQMELATPCAEWNVGQLIDHMVGAQQWGDFQAAAQACAASFSEEGALEKMVNPGFGDMPGAAMLGLVMNDTFTHAWDLAQATGQDTNLNPEMAQQILAAAQQMIQPAFRSEEGAIFGMEQQAPEGANAATQLAAFLGRKV